VARASSAAYRAVPAASVPTPSAARVHAPVRRPPTAGRDGATATENDWAAACVARIRGRLGDPAALREALDRWDALGAGYELACTLLLIPGRETEGYDRLAALGVPRP
jgi:hypothetical protein